MIKSEQIDLFKPSQLIITHPSFTFIDLFAGIGGFRIPLEQLGGKCLGYSEIDKEAIKVYEKNFRSYQNRDEKVLGDVNQLDQLGDDIDLITGGVPCQPWSIAGKGKGFNDPRGTLWFKVIELVRINQPKAFIFENVKGLTEPRNQDSLHYIITNLEKSGYIVKYNVLNSYDFGLSQDRDRVFIVGIRNDLEKANQFTFPQPLDIHPKLYDFIPDIEKTPIRKKKFSIDILFDGRKPASRGRFQKDDELNDFFLFADIRDGHTTIHSWDIIPTTSREKLICYTILRHRRKKKYGEKDGNPLSYNHLQELIPNLQEKELEKLVNKSILRFVSGKGYEFVNSKISAGIKGISKIFLPHADVIGTLTATETRDYIAMISIPCQEPEQYKQTFLKEIYKKKRFKPLSARDYARLQGFPEWFIIAESESTAKKQFGNAVSIPVVYSLSKQVLSIIV